MKTCLESDANSDGEKESGKEKDCSHNVEKDEKEAGSHSGEVCNKVDNESHETYDTAFRSFTSSYFFFGSLTASYAAGWAWWCEGGVSMSWKSISFGF